MNNFPILLYLPKPWTGCDTRSIFKQISAKKLTFKLVSSLSFEWLQTKTKEPYYLPIVKRRNDIFMPFPRTLAQNEMQTT